VSLQPWAPQPGPQLAAIDAAWCPELMFGGARGGGKSDYLLGDWCMDAGTYGPEWRGILFRKTYKQLEELAAQSRRIIPACYPGSAWSKSEWTWTTPGGASLKMRHLDSELDAEEYQGHQFAWVGFDELGNWPSDRAYRMMTACLRNGSMPIPVKRIRGSANPGGSGHQWVKSRFIDPAPGGYVPIEDKETGMQRMFIPSRVVDNAILLANDPGYVDRLKGVGSQALVKAWLEGDWTVVAGAFFDEWSMDRHVVAPFEVPDDWARFIAGDWGSAKPFSFHWFAIASEDFEVRGKVYPRGCLVVYREWYGMKEGEPNVGLKMPAEEVGAGLASRTLEKLAYGVLDPAAFASDGGPSIAERIRKGGGPSFRPADNKRVPRSGAMGGWDQFRARLRGDGDGRPMIVFFSTCVHAIRTIPSMQHDAVKPEDIDTTAEDHCFSGETLVQTSAGVVTISSIVGRGGFVLSSDGNWHQFRSARLVKRDQPVVRLAFSDGSIVKCTPDHKFLTATGWVDARDLAGLETLSLSETALRSSPASGFTSAGSTISERAAAFIVRCGKRLTAISRMASMFTTGTTTEATMPYRTSNAFPCGSIWAGDMARHPPNAANRQSWWRERLRELGTVVRRGALGIASIMWPSPRLCTPSTSLNAGNAVEHSPLIARAFARMPARRHGVEHPVSTTSAASARSAARSSWSTGTISNRRAHEHVAGWKARAFGLVCLRVEDAGREDVYCLTVPETGNFALANGAIVANCADAIRYGLMSRPYIRNQPIIKAPVHDYISGPDNVIRSGLTFREIVERRARKRRQAS